MNPTYASAPPARNDDTPAAGLRRALERFAAGVVVVATRGEAGAPRAALASAFNSVSLDPPLLLWCVPTATATWMPIDRAYGLSVLSAEQAALADLRCLEAEPLAWEFSDLLGAPRLRDAAAWFEVVAVRRIAHGDHDLYLAQVAGLGYAKDGTGLLRYSGNVVHADGRA